MKAIEIAGSNEEKSLDFFRALEGLPSGADTWALVDWRNQGGGVRSSHGFYFHIKDFCSNGYCRDGKWIFSWFCEEQQRYKDVGGLVGFKWKRYMSSFRTQPALNVLKILAASRGSSSTPIQVIRSRRNPLDANFSELKHSLDENLPGRRHSNDKECVMTFKLVVPVTEMLDWLQSTYEEENEVDAFGSVGCSIHSCRV